MKKAITTGFMFTWFVFHSGSEQTVAKFLNLLPPASAKEAKIVTLSSLQQFYVFYNADEEVKLN